MSRRRPSLACWLLLLAGWAFAAQAEAGSSPAERLPAGLGELVDLRLPPVEAALWEDAADGRLDQHSLLAAALVASGVHDRATLTDRLARFDRLVAEVTAQLQPADAPRRRASVALETLHRRLFVGQYRATASSLADVFNAGDYNCISSVILFVALAERLNLRVEAVEVPGHAFARLETLPGRWMRVETTCGDWLEAEGDNARQQALLARVTGQSLAEPAGGGRQLSPVGMVATLYYNRGVDLLEQQAYADALLANSLAWALDAENTTAWSNLLAAINNWSLDRCTAGDYRNAVELLTRGMRVAPAHRNFQVNYVAVHERWLIRLCLEGRHHEALMLADRLVNTQPAETQFQMMRLDVLTRWSGQLAARGRYDEAWALLGQARRDYPHHAEVSRAEDHLRRQQAGQRAARPAGLTGGTL